jgi:hypothetical protein
VAQVVECLFKALSSNLSIDLKKRKSKEKKEQGGMGKLDKQPEVSGDGVFKVLVC